MSFGDAIEILTEFAEAEALGRLTFLDRCDVSTARMPYGTERRADAADAFLVADVATRVEIRARLSSELARVVRDRASDAANLDATYRHRKARQSRELRARRALKAGRRPGVTGRPRVAA